jgi:hypothetical protein
LAFHFILSSPRLIIASYVFPFPAFLLSDPSLCIISVSLHFVFNPIHKHVHSYRHHAILVLIPMPYLIVATSCHFLFLLPFFLSSAVGHCSVDLGQSVSASHSHPFQFLHALNAPTPFPCLHFPAPLSPYLHCTLRSCPGTPTCSHLTRAFDREGNEQRCPSHT